MEDEAPGSDELDTTTNDTHDDLDLDLSGDDGLGDEHTEGDGDGEGEGDGLEDVEWEGKNVRVPPEVKAALMRTADYTRKTQEVAQQRKTLEEAAARLTQQVEHSKEIDQERVNLALVETQLKAMDRIDWDKLEEEDPDEVNRLFRQQQRLRAKADEIRGSLSQKQNNLDLERQRTANEQRATAVQECVDTLKRDIKGWNNDLAVKIGEFAVEKLGWSPEAVTALTHAPTIKALHGAYTAAQMQRRAAVQNKLDAGDRTAPVSRPGGGSPNQRRTTDGSGDKLSTTEWMKRENARLQAKRKAGR
jgi:hypothetical protein